MGLPELPKENEVDWYAKRTAFDLAVGAYAESAYVEAETFAGRIESLEVLGGLEPGAVSDATMANISLQPDSLFTNASRAQYGTWINVMSKGINPATNMASGSLDSTGSKLNILFKTPGTYYFPVLPGKSLYVIEETVTIGPNVNIICHPEAHFILKDYVRNAGDPHVHMFVTDPAISNGTISWTGGHINSNESNQYSQGGDGVNYDVFKGIIVMNADKVTFKNMKFSAQRGSAIEHWNITHFICDDIEVQAKIPTLNGQESGGYRRGGITGSSRFISINNVYGYAGDDLVCVAAGIDWGQDGKTRINIDTAVITNIRPTEKLNQLGRGTWSAVTAYAQDGYTIKNLVIDNVSGVSQGSMIRIGSYAYGSDLPGTIENHFHNVIISNITGYMRGFTAPDGLYNGSNVPSVAFISLPSLKCRSLVIRDVLMQMYDEELFENPVISAGGSAIETMIAQNVRFQSSSTTVQNCPIYSQGSGGYVQDATFSNCGHAYPNATVWGTRLIYQSTSNSVVKARVVIRDCVSGDQGLLNPQINATVVNGRIVPMSDEVCMNFTDNSIYPATGAILNDPATGVIAYRNGYWVTVRERMIPYSTNLGKPSSGRWEEGFRTQTIGSPFKSIIGYVCIQAGVFGVSNPIFLPLTGALTTTSNTGLLPTTPITSFAPGVTISHEIGSANSSGWPGNVSGMVTTCRGTSDAFSWQEYRLRDDPTARLNHRRWDNNNNVWAAWSNA